MSEIENPRLLANTELNYWDVFDRERAE